MWASLNVNRIQTLPLKQEQKTSNSGQTPAFSLNFGGVAKKGGATFKKRNVETDSASSASLSRSMESSDESNYSADSDTSSENVVHYKNLKLLITRLEFW
jgi:hypothetical protein